ncbi:hypothetical protein F5X96DRAFT_651347 [Biscogniauxia mediterranea]|nr:hypothetical protein F5X96DRAFT_651347 [Biscogniauxia mediterranea]
MSSSRLPPPLSYGRGLGPAPSPSSTSVLTPTSTTASIYTSPDSTTTTHPQYYLAKSEIDDGASSASSSVTAAPATSAEPAKKKQKRNKPTLSCHECVERKTKASHHLSSLLAKHRCTAPEYSVSITWYRLQVPGDRCLLALSFSSGVMLSLIQKGTEKAKGQDESVLE